jgi:hypothetical protein
MGLFGGLRPPSPQRRTPSWRARIVVRLSHGTITDPTVEAIDHMLANTGGVHRLTTDDVDALLDARHELTSEHTWRALTSDTSTARREPAR